VLGPPRPLPAPAIGEHNTREAIWQDVPALSEAGG
jgi:hypothetical protein